MYNWRIARSARLLRLRFFRRFLLWLRLFRPGRHDSIHARVGNGLAEMLAKMSRNHEEGSAQGGLTVEHLLRFVGIGVVEGDDGIAEVREGILHSLKDFRFVTREAREDFADRSNALGRTPSVFLRRHGLGKAHVALLVVGDLFQEFGAQAGCWSCRYHGMGLTIRALLCPARRSEAQG